MEDDNYISDLDVLWIRLKGTRDEILMFFETIVPFLEEQYDMKLYPEEPKPERGRAGMYRSYIKIPLKGGLPR